jgi:hypothetical protein
MNNSLLNVQWATEEIKGEIKICLESNENENTTYQNFWYTEKAALKGKFITMNVFITKSEIQINNLIMHFTL